MTSPAAVLELDPREATELAIRREESELVGEVRRLGCRWASDGGVVLPDGRHIATLAAAAAAARLLSARTHGDSETGNATTDTRHLRRRDARKHTASDRKRRSKRTKRR